MSWLLWFAVAIQALELWTALARSGDPSPGVRREPSGPSALGACDYRRHSKRSCCRPWRDIIGSGEPCPSIHGRTFASAADADRASA